jgi:serine/threonine protein phosphatase PrpC
MNNSNIRVTVQSDKGKWKRRNDEYLSYLTLEDSQDESSHGTIIALADGQGGNINSNLCAKISVESLIEAYQEEDTQKKVEDRLLQAFQKIHRLIKEKAVDFHTPGMICALTAIVIKDNFIWIGQVGGNSVFLLKPNNELIKLNTETETFIGQEEEIKPLVQKVTLDPGTRILLVSDGITCQLTNEIIAKACSHGTPSAIIHQLIQLGTDAGGDDNMTVCLIESGKFSKKTTIIPEKETSPVERKVIKPTGGKRNTSFLIWIFIILLLIGGIFLVTRYYSKLMGYLLPGIEKPVNEVVVKPPDVPPPVKEVPEASLMVMVTPNTANVFFYEGEVPLNEKQKEVFFYTESSPAIIKGLKTGTYTLIVGKEGYETRRFVIQIKDTDLTKQLQYPLILTPVEKETGTTIPEPPTKPVEIQPSNPPDQPPIEIYSEIIIQSDPTGAKIYINGAATGLITPNVIKKKPGVYLVQVMKDGYDSASRSVDLSEGASKQSIFLKLSPLPVSLSVTSQPSGAKIYIDNIFTTLYTPATLSLTLGSHTIMINKAGFEEQAITITVKPSEPLQPLSFILKRKPGTNRTINYWGLPYEN